MRYRMEDQENRNRRKNLRIRGLPDLEGEDLQVKLDKLFGHILGKIETEKIKFERIHRIRKPAELAAGIPRDVIARFHNFQDKEQIWQRLKTIRPVTFNETELQIFPDLATETLSRRRLLKPLLEHLKVQGIQYSWGYPACLIGKKEGRSATLRFPEEMTKFCKRLDIPLIEIPGWNEPQEKISPIPGHQTWNLIPGNKRGK